MKTGQRIDVLRKLGRGLEQRDFSDSNLILRNFGCHTYSEFDESNYDYFLGRVEDLDNDKLVELYEYLFPGELSPPELIPPLAAFGRKDT